MILTQKATLSGSISQSQIFPRIQKLHLILLTCLSLIPYSIMECNLLFYLKQEINYMVMGGEDKGNV